MFIMPYITFGMKIEIKKEEEDNQIAPILNHDEAYSV